MKSQCAHGDHSALIIQLLNEVQPRKIVRKVIEAAYAAGYEKHSDGITLMPELEFASFRMRLFSRIVEENGFVLSNVPVRAGLGAIEPEDAEDVATRT